MTILLVDDDVLGMATRRKLLEVSGHRVLTAQDEGAALDFFSAIRFDLVVLDYRLGEHTAEGLISRLRAVEPTVPLLLLSGAMVIPTAAQESVEGLIVKGGGGAQLLLSAVDSLTKPS